MMKEGKVKKVTFKRQYDRHRAKNRAESGYV